MAAVPEDLLDRTLRWMNDNLQGANNAKYPPGHPQEGDHCVNSGTCILVCCYINALGKVLLKGGPAPKSSRRDFQRFRAFLRCCMPDFLDESSRTPLPKSGDEWLYEVFRCGFIHNYYPGTDGAWSRRPNLKEYWFSAGSRKALNVDELVRGFERGLKNSGVLWKLILTSEPISKHTSLQDERISASEGVHSSLEIGEERSDCTLNAGTEEFHKPPIDETETITFSLASCPWGAALRCMSYNPVSQIKISFLLDFGHFPRNAIAGKWQLDEGFIAAA